MRSSDSDIWYTVYGIQYVAPWRKVHLSVRSRYVSVISCNVVLCVRSDDVVLNSKKRGSVESLDAVSHDVEVEHMEPPRLVQPNEVVISSTETCVEKPDSVQSPFGQFLLRTFYHTVHLSLVSRSNDCSIQNLLRNQDLRQRSQRPR